jgi:hypothetical protein
VTAISVNVQPARAAGYAPWCAVFDFGRGGAQWDCHYRSIEDCRPNVIAGNRGFCNPNPAWRASAEPRKWRRHHRRVRHY